MRTHSTYMVFLRLKAMNLICILVPMTSSCEVTNQSGRDGFLLHDFLVGFFIMYQWCTFEPQMYATHTCWWNWEEWHYFALLHISSQTKLKNTKEVEGAKCLNMSYSQAANYIKKRDKDIKLMLGKKLLKCWNNTVPNHIMDERMFLDRNMILHDI